VRLGRPGLGADHAGELEQRRRRAGADVHEDPVAGRDSRRGERRDDVVDEDEVTDDRAVLVDVDRLPAQSHLREQADDAGVRVGERLPRAVDVLQTQHREPSSMRARPRAEHVLLRELGRRVDVGGARLRVPGSVRQRTTGTADPVGRRRIPRTGGEPGRAAHRGVVLDAAVGDPAPFAVHGP
jgi:hypothetical protein